MAKTYNANRNLKRVVLIASEKGGVGKSVKARALIDHLRSEGVKLAAYDADGSVGALVRVLGTRTGDGRLAPQQDPVKGVGYYNVRADGERNTLLDAIASGDEIIVHDLAGGSLADLTRVVDGGEGLGGLLAAFGEHGYRLTIVHVISPEIGSAQSVARWIDLVGDHVDHIVVRNSRWGRSEADFPFWYGFTDGQGVSKGGKTREKLHALGGLEIDLPALPAGTYAKTDAENMAFSAAAANVALTITERAHIAKFRRDYAAAIEPARHLLGL
jgi:hypothetical protein